MEDAAQDIAQTGGCEPQRHGMVETMIIRATHGREIQVGQIVQQIRSLGAQAPGTGQGGRGAGLTCLKARQHLQTQEIAGKPRILVAGILNPEQGVLVGVSLKITTGHIQQGSPDGHPTGSGIPYAHAPCSPHPRPPQGAKQHGLSLIALVVGQNQACATGILLQSPMAGLPCRSFEPTRMIAPDHDLPHKKRHTQAVAKLPAPGEPAALTKPRELAWARTETSRVFLNPDGTHSVEVSNDRVNFKDDAGEWQPIDSSVGPSQADLSVLENAANDFTVTFAPLSKGGVKVVGPDGAELSFVPDVARDVAPKVGSKPNHVIYPEVWPGVDVEYIVRPSGVEEVLNVKRNPGRGTFPFLVGGAELRPSEGGGFDTFTKGKPSSLTVAPVSVTDRRGVAIDAAKAKPASAVGEVPQDSARRSSPAVKERFASPRRMDVAVDAGWLASLPAGEFPVRIDPTIGRSPLAIHVGEPQPLAIGSRHEGATPSP